MFNDYLFGLGGGILLGIAGIFLMLMNGRVLGVSGILGDAILLETKSSWRWAFIAGMLLAGLVTSQIYPEAFLIEHPRSIVAYLVAGLLVGIGTQIGGGCTSGHGICGIGRVSKRSIVATIIFMTTGAISVFIVEHMLGGKI